MIMREESETSPDYGCPPAKRSMQQHLKFGVVPLDKPCGPNSHLVAEWVKSILNVSKAGHSGTLDPKVSGVLPVCLEESTKVVGSLLTAGKEYVCLMHVHSDYSEPELMAVFSKFSGTIKQRPPVRSSVKREIRERTIYSLKILEIEGRNVLFSADVQAGTYIRKLCYDIGVKLGSGAHMAELRRTRAGPFREEDTVTLHRLSDAYHFWKDDGDEAELRKCVVPVEAAVVRLPRIEVKDAAVAAICYGSQVAVPGIVRLSEGIKLGDQVAVFSLKGELVAVGTASMTSEQMVDSSRGWAVKTDRVLMPRNAYPKMWG